MFALEALGSGSSSRTSKLMSKFGSRLFVIAFMNGTPKLNIRKYHLYEIIEFILMAATMYEGLFDSLRASHML